jgi:ketosteroid isomerase-like protein
MSESDAVLFANEAFYQAFASRDVALMDELWAREAPVACLHPGWPPLYERAAIIESWRRILENEQSPAIECVAPRAFVDGAAAFVICYERMEGGYLVATNLFRREARGWKIVHHQAGPVAGEPPEPPPAATPPARH